MKKIALIAALVIGTGSVALATDSTRTSPTAIRPMRLRRASR